MKAKKYCDHKGIEYPSVSAMCRAYGISVATYYSRRKRGWSSQEALETEVEKYVRGNVFDHKGVEYPSVPAMCKAYGISVATYYKRIKLGLSLQEALETGVEKEKIFDHKGVEYPSLSAMCRAYGIGVTTYYDRIKLGWSLQEALETEVEKYVRGNVFDHKGVEYPSVPAMCKAYGISVATYYKRIKLGLSLQEALETRVEKKKIFDHKGVEYPSLSAMCRAYGIIMATYYDRIKSGWSLQETLETEAEKQVRGNVFDHKGIEYPSLFAMCKTYGISPKTYRERRKKEWSLQEALETEIEKKKIFDHKGVEYPSASAMCRAYGISVTIYYNRRREGWSLQEALETGVEKEKIFDHKGVEYPSVNAMCRAYGISVTIYYNRRREGWSLQEALETKVEKFVRGNVFDHKGVGYPSVPAMCKAYGISVATYYKRRKLGWSLQESLTILPRGSSYNGFNILSYEKIDGIVFYEVTKEDTGEEYFLTKEMMDEFEK